jgi:hypothetical protein
MVEAIAKTPHLTVELVFAGMRKRSMTDVVAQCQRFSELLIEIERDGHGAGNLSDLDGVGKPVMEIVRETRRKNLCFILKPAKSPRMNNAVPIALELATVRVGQLRISPASAALGWKAQAA